MQGFVAWLRGATTVVKRDMEITRDEVRVMTVHGAKGLEAPVVILADTTTPPKGSRQPRLLEIEPPPYPPPQAGEGINRIPPPLAGEGREGVSGTPTCIPLVWAGRGIRVRTRSRRRESCWMKTNTSIAGCCTWQ